MRRTPVQVSPITLPRTLKARSRPTDSALQRHVSFIDDNGDRGVNVAECIRGLKALGMPLGVAETFAITIIAPLSSQTRGSAVAMNVDVDKIHKGIHEGDTGILDKRSRLSAKRFEKVFGVRATTDLGGGKAFTAADLIGMVNANSHTLFGYLAATAEWQLLLALAADTQARHDGRNVPALSVARIRAFYNGTLFYQLAKERARKV